MINPGTHTHSSQEAQRQGNAELPKNSYKGFFTLIAEKVSSWTSQNKPSISLETRITLPLSSAREEVLKDIPKSMKHFNTPALISKECSSELLQEIIQKQNKDINIREKSAEIFDWILGIEDSYGALSEEHLIELQAPAQNSKESYILAKTENKLQYFTVMERSL